MTMLYELIEVSAERVAEATALQRGSTKWSYDRLCQSMNGVASGLANLGLGRQDRVGIYLPKLLESVAACFGAARAGGTFVPLNPLLKPAQVGHIIRDSSLRILITSPERLGDLTGELADCPSVRTVVLVGTGSVPSPLPHIESLGWAEAFPETPVTPKTIHRVIDTDVAAILYTSGSTGRPKGVVLSHRNMVTGAVSVSTYLENNADDRLLAALPLSFDYGFSQLTTAFRVGARVVLIDHLFARDVINAVQREEITGLAAVPPLWIQLADLAWPTSITDHLRYITNSGGRMPRATLDKLRNALPRTKPYLMYGLTEAFRATYLPPSEVDRRPDSMGKAIPNTEVMVVRPDGSPCAPNEPGELVQRGSLVALGYWNDAAKTGERFKPVPGQPNELPIKEMAVWSGDTVRMDEDGYLYFVGRRDEMIKTSGYRVSPTEVEEVVYASGLVSDAVAVAAPHPGLGEGIVLVASPPDHTDRVDRQAATNPPTEALLNYCRARFPSYMVPQRIEWLESLPRNPNGKFDRPMLARQYRGVFGDSA